MLRNKKLALELSTIHTHIVDNKEVLISEEFVSIFTTKPKKLFKKFQLPKNHKLGNVNVTHILSLIDRTSGDVIKYRECKKR